MEEILSAFGLSDEDLTLDEQETVNGWLSALEAKGSLTLDDVRYQVTKLKDYLAQKLSEIPDDDAHRLENIMIKARLQNIVFLSSLLTSPVDARRELETYLARVKSMKGR